MVTYMLGMRCGVIVGGDTVVCDAERPNFSIYCPSKSAISCIRLRRRARYC